MPTPPDIRWILAPGYLPPLAKRITAIHAAVQKLLNFLSSFSPPSSLFWSIFAVHFSTPTKHHTQVASKNLHTHAHVHCAYFNMLWADIPCAVAELFNLGYAWRTPPTHIFDITDSLRRAQTSNNAMNTRLPSYKTRSTILFRVTIWKNQLPARNSGNADPAPTFYQLPINLENSDTTQKMHDNPGFNARIYYIDHAEHDGAFRIGIRQVLHGQIPKTLQIRVWKTLIFTTKPPAPNTSTTYITANALQILAIYPSRPIQGVRTKFTFVSVRQQIFLTHPQTLRDTLNRAQKFE